LLQNHLSLQENTLRSTTISLLRFVDHDWVIF
jgi:hypothetical protein